MKSWSEMTEAEKRLVVQTTRDNRNGVQPSRVGYYNALEAKCDRKQ